MTIQSAAKNKCDRLFSQLVRSVGYCEKCGRSEDVQLQCAHWISRRYVHTRTDPDNAFCLCAACHRWFTDHPTEWGRWAVEQRGEDVYARLFEASKVRGPKNWVAELESLTELAERLDR